MIYLDKNDLKKITTDWDALMDTICEAADSFARRDYSQPLKPYLRFGDPQNRIIAMPAYVGGNINSSGIKWIASFPDNIQKGIPRANSVTILNNVQTGEVEAIINTSEISVLRTSAVTGSLIRNFLKGKSNKFNIAIIGFGPIGQKHYEMLNVNFQSYINKIFIYDIRNMSGHLENNTCVVHNWEDAYRDADIVITCTVSDVRYINLPPKENALLLDVSLRDYYSEIYPYVKGGIIVDDWDEVNRENTDIEMFHNHCGLEKANTHTLAEAFRPGFFQEEKTYFFAPMGMAIFDIAIAKYYYDYALANDVGKKL